MLNLRRTKREPHRDPRGAIFVAALGVTVVLSGLLMVFAQEMRTEAIASANRMADAQAAAVEQAAEQWVLAQLETETDPLVLQQINSEGLFVGSTDSATTVNGIPNSSSGGGYFWIIRPNPDSASEWAYGIVDENSKLNINMADVNMLQRLPGITAEMASSIVEWHGGQVTAGAGSMYYGSLSDPYSIKNSEFETLDELLLVKDMTPEILYGLDRNRDGVLSDSESAGQLSTLSSADGVEDDSRGIAQYLTAWSRDTQTTQTGGQGGQAGGGGQRQTTTTVQHRVNANTASRGVLIALGFSGSQADSLISTRSTTTSDTNTAWISQAASGAPAAATEQLIANSQQFSADIVAVSADGRGYRRVKMVVDTSATPHTVVYRKDLTSLGFPLPPEIRESLRAGRGLEGVVSR